ncbi:WD40-repeat-containing domain protein [Blyttiomyces helicus]|uniref:WD40-repeat-containing domain protein n=1 Tax=Blyttiomyces helicus TaxID=388810 RepID=A0A4P9W8K1_9FUNG|nr:WD40-repeat-containing domain protein [Blyttiomyces helicus]|eukprot:RKO87785.1 WD40-repeat-containing domain protein [Blyttiomyces helicus]
MDYASAQFKISQADKPKPTDRDSIEYQEQIAKACGIALNQRILTFKADAPVIERESLRTTWNRPLRNPNARQRRIRTDPEKILDAPGITDDFYLSLMDWSKTNVLAVALENTVFVHNHETGETEALGNVGSQETVGSVQWSPDGNFLAVGLVSGPIQVWSLETMKRVRTMKGRISRVGVLSWDRAMLSSGGRDGSIWHHDVRTPEHKIAALVAHESAVCGLKWRPDGQMLASGGNDNKVMLWDARSTLPRMVKTDHQSAVKALAWCPWHLPTLASGGGRDDKMVHFWNTSTSGKIASVNTGAQVTSVIWSTEYKEFFTAHGFPNHHLSVWKYPSLDKVADLAGHDSRVLHTAISPDGEYVVTAAADENLKFWKVWEKRRKGVKSEIKQDENVDEELAMATRRLSIR